MVPSKDEAIQFAVMLEAGLPASEAILYFTDTDNPAELEEMLRSWLRSSAVKRALSELAGKDWTQRTLKEQCEYALEKHYRGLAYFLSSHHYSEVGEKDKAKLDTARNAIESKLAGTAGKGDALSRFLEDISTGKLNLPTPPKVRVN